MKINTKKAWEVAQEAWEAAKKARAVEEMTWAKKVRAFNSAVVEVGRESGKI